MGEETEAQQAARFAIEMRLVEVANDIEELFIPCDGRSVVAMKLTEARLWLSQAPMRPLPEESRG